MKHPVVLAFFLLAFFVRLVFVFQWNDLPYGHAPLLDAQAYDAWAKDIAQGEFLRGKAFYQSPLYPYLAGLLYALFGQSGVVLGIFNALLGAGCVAGLVWLTVLWFGVPAALITGTLASFYRPLIFFSAPLMKEPLALFLLTLFVGFAYRALSKNRMRDYAIAGVALGLCALVRGNVLLFAPLIAAVALWQYRKAAVANATVMIAVMLLAILPATLHNFKVSGDFVLVNYTDGFNLYIGNSPYANGTNQYPPEVSTDPVQEEMNTIWVASEAAGRPLKPSEVSAYWRDRAVSFMIENLVQTLWLVKNKVLAFWNAHETFDNYDPAFIEENFGTLLVLPLPTYWIVTFLAELGVVCGARSYPKRVAYLVGLTLAYMATLCVFYVTDRYRLPVVVFLLPLAGLGGVSLAQAIMAGRWKTAGAGLGIAGVFLFLGLRADPYAADLRAFNWGSLSMIYADMGRDAEALESLNKAITISPAQAGAAAYVRGSYALENLGREAEAEKLLLRAIELYPQSGIVQYNYGRFLSARARLKEGIAAFEKGMELSPYYLLNYFALAKGYGVLGEKEKAISYARRGLALDPSDPLLNDVLSELQ